MNEITADKKSYPRVKNRKINTDKIIDPITQKKTKNKGCFNANI